MSVEILKPFTLDRVEYTAGEIVDDDEFTPGQLESLGNRRLAKKLPVDDSKKQPATEPEKPGRNGANQSRNGRRTPTEPEKQPKQPATEPEKQPETPPADGGETKP